LDNFKEINDTFGHAAGDRVLETLSERLTRALAEGVRGRAPGGRRVSALFVETRRRTATSNTSRRRRSPGLVLASVARPLHVGDHEIEVTVSVGIALCPHDADKRHRPDPHAMPAMYHAKRAGRHCHVFYAPEMNAAAVERLLLKSKLRRALERNEFVLRYQPKVDLASSKVVGAEVHCWRWRPAAGHGDIAPAQFIPLAEESRLILDIRRLGAQPGVQRLRGLAEQLARPAVSWRSTCRSGTEPGELRAALPRRVREAWRVAEPGRTRDHRDEP